MLHGQILWTILYYEPHSYDLKFYRLKLNFDDLEPLRNSFFWYTIACERRLTSEFGRRGQKFTVFCIDSRYFLRNTKVPYDMEKMIFISRCLLMFYSMTQQNVFNVHFLSNSECKSPFINFSMLIINLSKVLFSHKNMFSKLLMILSRPGVCGTGRVVLLSSVWYQKLLSDFVRVSDRI